MKILYYDCFSGISGDMNLGAMIDLGVSKEYLISELSKLKVDGYEILVSVDQRKGITGTKVDVILEEDKHSHINLNKDHYEHNHEHEHEHDHDHAHNHNHNHEHTHSHADEHNQSHQHNHHEHRNLSDIEKIIDESTLNESVKEISKRVFLKVAEAEAKIHGKPLNEVHFHEVGALDSIVDIIGAAICLDYLKVDRIMASSVEVGGGFVNCAHGRFPVPAPATTEILRGIPIKLGAVPFETTTPTGAAILAAVVDEFSDKKEFVVDKIGYGIGHRDTEIPNVLRVILGEDRKKSKSRDSVKDLEIEDAYMLECNIDDMNPELYDYIMEKLFKLGAMDVFLTPIIMKKGRPGVKLSILCCEALIDSMNEVILTETTTLGTRKYKVQKTMLRREFADLDTAYGKVKVKKSFYNGNMIKAKPEYDDCRRIAINNNIPINTVYEKISKIITQE